MYKKFGDLNVGDFFISNKTGNRLMKTHELQLINHILNRANAVILTGRHKGKVTYFKNDDVVA